MAARRTSTKGFKRTDSLLSRQIRSASERRGFAQTRLLTQWAEIAGEETAAIALPVEVSYSRGGMGATLTLLTTGPNAPMLEMQKEQLRAKVNAVYGYNAISRVRITQTAPQGFAEGQVAFAPAKAAAPAPVDPALQRKAAEAAQPVADEGLRAALERLGANVLMKTQS
ncbi:DUF721 domain-containing protein [uncultured Sulfitobacter sp.]|uniref:DUF721 domain-containing protein n=1 Tax=uncultured Sulfitobacter sp. TaxID=191468 RepID=UPI00262728EE|nr:DciA family protein [uncultured Sulfitobacter sp.]